MQLATPNACLDWLHPGRLLELFFKVAAWSLQLNIILACSAGMQVLRECEGFSTELLHK